MVSPCPIPQLLPAVAAEWRLAFVLPGRPVGKARQRHRIAWKLGKGGRKVPYVQNYDPRDGPSAVWQRRCREYAALGWSGRKPLEGCLLVEFRAVSARPKELLPKRHPDGRIWRPRKPDVDNVEKGILDALTGARVLSDDNAVVHTRPFKAYAARGEEPCTEILVGVVLGDPPPALPIPREELARW